MTVRTAVEDEQPGRPSRCWCCGALEEPARLVYLGEHPDVAICIGCAHWLSRRAWELEDQARIGPAVHVRDRSRRLRNRVVSRGGHRNRFLGRPLRWLGRFTP